MDLENLLFDLEKDLFNIVRLLQANHDSAENLRRKFYVELSLMELYDVSKPVSLTILREERVRLLNHRQELKLKIVEKLGKSTNRRVVLHDDLSLLVLTY